MASDKFRHQLKKEAQQWQAEGLIDSSIFEELSQRYQFDSLEADSQNRFVVILFGLGGLLLGLGLITLVAANWQGWSRGLRVVLLLSLFIAVNTAGFLGWYSSHAQWRRLGKALLLLGALILGANLGLMSQMFHQSGEVYQLYLVWGTGVLAMAYGLQFTWLAILAILLVGIGYWWGLPDIFDFSELRFATALMRYVPLLATFLFIPLANFCQSKWVLVWAVVAVVSSFEVTVIQELSDLFASFPLLAGGVFAGAMSLPSLLLWGYQSNTVPAFRKVTRRLSILFLAGVCYLFSFHYLWLDFSLRKVPQPDFNHYSAVLVQGIIFSSLTIYYWWRLGNNGNAYWQFTFPSTLVAIAAMIVGLVAGGSVIGLNFPDSAWLPTTVYNILLFSLGVTLVRQGLKQGTRLTFWTGLGLLTLQIFSRMFEYQTGLLLKAVILFFCGLAVIFAGLWFERHRNHNS